jgi:hypothetical protein
VVDHVVTCWGSGVGEAQVEYGSWRRMTLITNPSNPTNTFGNPTGDQKIVLIVKGMHDTLT